MYDSILKRIRECIQSGNYRITEHARDESFEEGITMLEITNTLLSGVIVEKQRDLETNESKFIIRNSNPLPIGLEVVVKFGVTGKLYILTVYSI